MFSDPPCPPTPSSVVSAHLHFCVAGLGSCLIFKLCIHFYPTHLCIHLCPIHLCIHLCTHLCPFTSASTSAPFTCAPSTSAFASTSPTTQLPLPVRCIPCHNALQIAIRRAKATLEVVSAEVARVRLARQKEPAAKPGLRGGLVADLRDTAQRLETLRVSLCTGRALVGILTLLGFPELTNPSSYADRPDGGGSDGHGRRRCPSS